MTFGLEVLTYCTKSGFSLLQKIRQQKTWEISLLPCDCKIFFFFLISNLQKYFSITCLLSQFFIMYVLGIQYKEKWNKMAVIAVARCKFILAKKVICAQYRACLSLCQENYYEWGMDGMKFCIIHDYMLLNFIEESWSTPDIPDATKRSCIPHCWRQHIPQQQSSLQHDSLF